MNAKVDFRYHEPHPVLVDRLYDVYDFVAKYHRHRVLGLHNVPTFGRCLIVVNHSFATYDIGMLINRVLKDRGRLVRPLGDRALFYWPAFGKILGKTGAVPAQPNVGEYLLERDEIALVAPGGMREALRPSQEKYQVRWQNRKGFVRLAVKTQTPIILAACPEADDLYTVYENALTKLVYRAVRLPVPSIRGFGPTLLPRPVQLTHHLSELLLPPAVDRGDDRAVDQVVDHWHEELSELMNTMLEDYRPE
ncbi:MAG: acyltransferase family protein [Pseudomonadales bacterium]|nr:acyltransferase family protein [Pseudomonadales bacterium]